MSVNSRLKATKIILVTSRNGDRKIMQSIRITSRPTSKKGTWNQLSQFWITSTNVIPTEKTWAGHISTMSQEFRRRASEGPTVLHIHFWSLSCLAQFQVATTGISPDVTTVFHTRAYGRFIEIKSNLRRKKLYRTN